MQHRLPRTLGFVLSVMLFSSIAGPRLAAGMVTDPEYDANGYAWVPATCPPSLPYTNWLAFFTIWDPATFWVPKYLPSSGTPIGGVASYHVPFAPISYTKSNGTMGSSWYTPDQVESDRFENLLWLWEGGAGTDPGVLVHAAKRSICSGSFVITS